MSALGELPPARLPRGPWSERVLAEIGGALDAAALRAAVAVVERALIPTPGDLAALRASSGALLDPALQAEPRRFFSFLDEAAHRARATTRRRRTLAGGRVLSRRLESDYRPYGGGDPALPPGPIHLEHWVHERRRAPATVLALHGFGMGRPRLDAAALLAARWFRSGLDVALLTLPHHGARTPAEARMSGEAFAVPHVARLAEAVREAVYEIRLTAHWLREEAGAPVGLLGLSLGGYLTALAAGLLDELAFAVPIAAPVCMGDLAWRFLRRTKHHRAGAPELLGAEELRRSFRVVPPEHALALARHWGDPPLHWFSGSHLAPFGRARVAEAVLGHLHGLGLA